MQVNEITDSVWFVGKHQAIVEFTVYDVTNGDKNEGRLSDYKYAKAGEDNMLPVNAIKLARGNDSKPELLAKVANYIYGSGPQLFRKIVENGKIRVEAAEDYEMEAWAEDVELDEYYMHAANQWAYFSQVFAQFGLSAFGYVRRLKSMDFVNTRAEVMDPATGRIKNYFILSDWASSVNEEKNPMKVLPAYFKGIEQIAPDFLMHVKLPVPGQTYYGFANWMGSMNWTKVANLIPLFHAAGLKNGYNIKYHVKVPRQYWERYPEDKREAKKEEFRQALDKTLSNVENTNKLIISEKDWDPSVQKEIPGLEIIPLNNPNPDKQYIELSKLANQIQASSHGINPALAGIEIGGTLGQNSSAIRLAHLYTIATLTPIPRARISKPVEVACKINRFKPDLFWGFKDVELSTLDDNPTGTQTIANNQQ